MTGRPARAARSSRSQRHFGEGQPVGVVAVQADLASGGGDELEGLGDLAPVGLRLVAVLLVRVAGDHVEGRGHAAHILAAQELREGPEGVAAAPGVARQPVGAVAQLAADAAGVQVPGGAQRAVAGGGEPAARPSPQVVEVVGERDREAAARSPEGSGGRERLEAELGEARRQGAAQELGVAVHGRLVDLQCRVRGEDARREGQPPVLVALGGRALVPAGEQDERGGDEVEGDGEAGAGIGGPRGDGCAVAAPARREGAGRQRPAGGDELHRAGVARDRRHAGDRLGGVRQSGAARSGRVAGDRGAAAQRRQQCPQRPLGARREGVRRADEDGQLGRGHGRHVTRRPSCAAPASGSAGRPCPRSAGPAGGRRARAGRQCACRAASAGTAGALRCRFAISMIASGTSLLATIHLTPSCWRRAMYGSPMASR